MLIIFQNKKIPEGSLFVFINDKNNIILKTFYFTIRALVQVLVQGTQLLSYSFAACGFIDITLKIIFLRTRIIRKTRRWR